MTTDWSPDLIKLYRRLEQKRIDPIASEGTMTNDEMAAELRKAGWRVAEPLTQANCKHPMMRGGGGMSCDGSGYQESYCMACGYRSRSEWGPSGKPLPLPQN